MSTNIRCSSERHHTVLSEHAALGTVQANDVVGLRVHLYVQAQQVAVLAAEKRFDCLLIESTGAVIHLATTASLNAERRMLAVCSTACKSKQGVPFARTGISEPMPVAATFHTPGAAGDTLSTYAGIDSMVSPSPSPCPSHPPLMHLPRSLQLPEACPRWLCSALAPQVALQNESSPSLRHQRPTVISSSREGSDARLDWSLPFFGGSQNSCLIIWDVFSFLAAQTRSTGQRQWRQRSARLQVTVVDARALTEDLASLDSLADRRMAAGGADERRIADLIIDQIEFASLLLLNKCDLVSPVMPLPLQTAS